MSAGPSRPWGRRALVLGVCAAALGALVYAVEVRRPPDPAPDRTARADTPRGGAPAAPAETDWADGAAWDDDSGDDASMDRIDHPLVVGRLKGAEAEARLAQFARDWETAHDEDTGTVWVFEKYLEDLGLARIAGYFEGRKPGCHGELHNLGKVVADRTADAAEAMAVCGDACTYACIHGALKTLYADQARHDGDVTHARDDLVALCTTGTLPIGFYRGNCAHAAGHAFAIMAPDTRDALDLCTTFPGREYAYYCATGVFMQITPTLGRSLDAPAGPDPAAQAAARTSYCRGAGAFMGACLRFLLRDLRRPDHLERLAETCEALGGSQRLGCFNALGYLGRVRAVREPEYLNVLCGRGGAEDRDLCISGFALAKQGNTLRDGMEASCRAMLDRELSAHCLEQFGRHYYALGNTLLMRML